MKTQQVTQSKKWLFKALEEANKEKNKNLARELGSILNRHFRSQATMKEVVRINKGQIEAPSKIHSGKIGGMNVWTGEKSKGRKKPLTSAPDVVDKNDNFAQAFEVSMLDEQEVIDQYGDIDKFKDITSKQFNITYPSRIKKFETVIQNFKKLTGLTRDEEE